MVEHHKNYSVEHSGPFEELLQRDFLGFKGKYMLLIPKATGSACIP